MEHYILFILLFGQILYPTQCSSDHLPIPISNWQYTLRMRASDLETILDLALFPTSDNDSSSALQFFSNFSCFWISQENYLSYRVIWKVGKFNSKFEKALTSQISLWVSLITRGWGLINVDLLSVMSEIIEVNTIYKGTVSMFVIDYGFTPVTGEEIPMIQRDIQFISNFRKHLGGNQSTLLLGASFDKRNCNDKNAPVFRSLELNLIDFVLFAILHYDIRGTLDTLASTALWHDFCLDLVSRSDINVPHTVPISFKVFLNPLAYQPPILSYLAPYKVDTGPAKWLVMTVANVSHKVESPNNGYSGTSIDLNKWLSTPDDRNRKNFGIIPHFPYNGPSAKLGIPEFIHNFEHFVVRVTEPVENVKQFVQDILTYQTDLERQEVDKFLADVYNTNNFSVKIMLAIDLKGREYGNHIRLINQAMDIAKDVNKVSSGSMSSILLEWKPYCRHRNVKNVSAEECASENGKFLRVIQNTQKRYLDLEDEDGRGYQVKLGILLDRESILNMMPLMASSNFGGKFVNLVDMVVIKTSMDRNFITANGAVNASNLIIKEMGAYQFAIEEIMGKRRSDVFYFVNLFGCNVTAKEDIMNIVETTRFWERLNGWASMLNTIVLSNAPYELTNNGACAFRNKSSISSNLNVQWKLNISKPQFHSKTEERPKYENSLAHSELQQTVKQFPSVILRVYAQDLNTILDLDLPSINSTVEQFNKARVFIHSFSQLWLRMGKSTDFGNGMLSRAAEYNKKYYNNVSSDGSLKLWIPISIKADYSTHIQYILNNIKTANEIYNGTVSTIIFDCGELDRNLEFLTRITNTLRKVTQIESVKQLKIALRFERLVCLKYPNLASFFNVDFLIFSPLITPPLTGKDAIFSEIINLFPCLKRIDWRRIPSLYLPLHIEVDLNSSTIYNETNLVDLTNVMRGPSGQQIPIILPSVFNTKEHEIHSGNFIKAYKGFSKWLSTPTKFSKLHFGVSLRTEGAPLYSSHLLSSIVDSFGKLSLKGQMRVEQLVTIIAEYSTNQNLPLELNLRIQVLASRENAALIDHFLLATHKGNSISPGLVKTVVFDFFYCVKSAPALYGWKNCTEMLHYTRKQLLHQNRNKPNLGVVLNLEIITILMQFQNTKPTEIAQAFFNFNSADVIFIDLLFDRIDRISDQGSKDAAMLIIYYLLENKLAVKRMWPNVEIQAYLQVGGCTWNTSEIHELSEFVHYLEILNRRAISENITIFFDRGLQGPHSSCMANKTVSILNKCPCGWWQVGRRNLDNSMDLTFFVDKKSLAERLYNEKNPNPTSKPASPHKSQDTPISILYTVGIPVIVITILISVGIATAVYYYYYDSKYLLSKHEVWQFFHGREEESISQTSNEMMTSLPTDDQETAQSQHYNMDKYELLTSQFSLDRTRALGSGEFCSVFQGTVTRNNETVNAAGKTAKWMEERRSYGYYLALKGLASEIKILSYLGEHSNIVGLLGAYTQKIRAGKIFVFLEFCELGSLQKYLRLCHSENIQNDETAGESTQNTEKRTELSEMLMKWTREIACGMEYMASKKVVHADLAARNVLLTSTKCAKISDFGLSRRLLQYSEYLKTTPCPLPWRWMPPESITRKIFNEKSDVWAFGITLWEIFTLGDEPYPGLSWDDNFPVSLESGMRLPKPDLCEDQMYDIMKQCWDIGPSGRPTFTEIRVSLK